MKVVSPSVNSFLKVQIAAKCQKLKAETAISLRLINHGQFDFIFEHGLPWNKGKFLMSPKHSRMLLSP